MPTPFERAEALREAGELLNQIARESEKHVERFGDHLPEELQQKAWLVLRHYPSAQEIEESRSLSVRELLDSVRSIRRTPSANQEGEIDTPQVSMVLQDDLNVNLRVPGALSAQSRAPNDKPPTAPEAGNSCER